MAEIHRNLTRGVIAGYPGCVRGLVLAPGSFLFPLMTHNTGE
jgi:hypothetical protein